MTESANRRVARRRSGWAGIAGVAVNLGVTELFAGWSTAVPSAISAIGGFVIDHSPSWLKTFAISTFGTGDKAVLTICIVGVALLIGWFVGRASVRRPLPMVITFAVAAFAGLAAQLGEPGAVPMATTVSTIVATVAGLLVWYGIVVWSRPVQSDGSDRRSDDPGRRRLVIGVAGAVTVSAITIWIGRSMIQSRAEARRSAVGLPVPVERQANPTAANDFGLDALTPIVTPSDEFYRIDTSLVLPVVDPDGWTLTIKGMVAREVVLTYSDIAAMPLVERYVTLACVSNTVGGDLVGNALWTGLLLKDLLDMAGVERGADQIVARSIDGWTAGFPTELALDGRDALLAIGMNRDVLPAEHGFPARLVVPGLYGYVSATKWISEIELTTWAGFDGYWVPRGWSKEAPIKTQSRIDRPRSGSRIETGEYMLGGVAWSPTNGIERVEVQVDDGPWTEAELSKPLSNDAWLQWILPATFGEGTHLVRVRATDRTGVTQSRAGSLPAPDAPDGAEGWHTVKVSAESA
ncbi:MAG: molybdopterin-dependent oxidoreductase [Acidimicrobiia bacterium]|nr:molybdopterin-dependent oxidoreductase [Acidimicrobiia bacterium]